MNEKRSHYNWKTELKWSAKKGNVLAQRILDESREPGEYFDGNTHFFDLIHVLRKLKNDPGVMALGIFGSRLRKEHQPLESDIDILVINDTPIIHDWSPSQGPTSNRDTYRFTGIANGINIQECSTENWRQTANNPSSVDKKTYETTKSVHWLWIKPGYNLSGINKLVK